MSKGRDTKPHIGIFGRRNNGKSSFINALTGQDISIVSDVPGTTTDPVKRSIEIGGIGPAILIDTAGIDDTGELGEKRIAKTKEVLGIIDLASLIIVHNDFSDAEKELISEIRKKDIPFFIVHNKQDEEQLDPVLAEVIRDKYSVPVIGFNSLRPDTLNEIIRAIEDQMPETVFRKRTLIGDLITQGDVVLLITPIDIEAPEGRMILPQVQVIRDVLDHDGIAVVCKERDVDAFFKKMNPKPALVITDSQVFPKADAAIPKDIPLTSFSIVLARQKGDFDHYLEGTPAISRLKDGDRVLILESCSHHVTCDDIGRTKIPRWISNFTGKKLEFDTVAGLSGLPMPVREYSLVIQCGACMITRRQLLNRLNSATEAGVPVTNYGLAIAYVHGIFDRAIAPFRRGEGKTADYL